MLEIDEVGLREVASAVVERPTPDEWEGTTRLAKAVLALLDERERVWVPLLKAAEAVDESTRGAGGSVDRSRAPKQRLREAIRVARRRE
jgi:hypothetical protein